MNHAGTDETEQPLLTGDTVHVIASRSGAAIRVSVMSVDGLRVRVRTAPGQLAKGERVRLRHVVPDDARYTSEAVVEVGAGGTTLVRSGPWRRHQQRDCVRLRLDRPIACEIRVLAEASRHKAKLPFVEAETALHGHILDISASGALIEPPRSLAIGERLRLAFDLPSEFFVIAEAMVVRQVTGRSKAQRAGVRFSALGRGAESQIVGYIYAAQAARRRTSLV